MTPRHVAVALLPALLALLCSSCRDLGPATDPLQEEINLQRARWESRRPSAYVYEVERICFCAEGARGPARIRVQGTQVVGRTYTASGAPVDSDFQRLFPSVDGLFDVLDDALDRGADQIQVQWDDELGMPVYFYIDYVTLVFDDELAVKVTALTAEGGT
jgi:hypothetical protein